MKKLQILACAILFTVSGIQLIEAKIETSEDKRSQDRHKINKVVNKAVNKALNATSLKAATIANDAINAYNQAVIKGSVNGTAIQTSAIHAIENLKQIYQSYEDLIQTGTAPVTFISSPLDSAASGTATNIAIINNNSLNSDASSTPTASTNNSFTTSGFSNFQCSYGSPSQCGNGSNATCADGTVISGVSCTPFDGTTDISDVNGICPTTWTQIPCNDNMNYPVCTDGTAPC